MSRWALLHYDLISSAFLRPYLQTQSHSEVLGVGILTHKFGGDIIHPITLRYLCLDLAWSYQLVIPHTHIYMLSILSLLFSDVLIFLLGEGNGNPLQCSCLENPRDGGAWWAAVGRDWSDLAAAAAAAGHSDAEGAAGSAHYITRNAVLLLK